MLGSVERGVLGIIVESLGVSALLFSLPWSKEATAMLLALQQEQHILTHIYKRVTDC